MNELFLIFLFFSPHLKQGFFHLAEALDWVRCVGSAKILQSLEELGDCGRVKLAIVFAECEYGHPWRGQKRGKITFFLRNGEIMNVLIFILGFSSRK